ncbi:hypothetical protein ACOSQ3_023957 [Xanthoceras sorbifolium]
MSRKGSPSANSDDYSRMLSSSEDSSSRTSATGVLESAFELPHEYTADYDYEEYYCDKLKHERFAINHVRNLANMSKVAGYLEEFVIPPSVIARLSGDDEPTSAPVPGSVAFHPTFLKVGVRLPLQPYLRRVFREIGITLAQLSPNGWRILIGI